MKTAKGALIGIALVAFLAGLSYLVWRAWTISLAWVAQQPSEVAGATIAFAGTVIAGIGAVVISQQRTKSREIAESHRPRKMQLYLEFITKVVDMMRKGRKKGTADPKWTKEFEEFFFDFTSRVMLWGSPKVLRSYGAFRRAGEDPKIVLLMDDLLQSMRKDLGLSNWGLSRGDLIKMLLTDPETLDALLTGR